jgi:Na+-driven multidrug efflux pump
VKYNTIFMVLVSAVFLLGSEQIVGFMNKDAAVGKIAIQALHIICLGYVFYGAGMVFINAFNGAGDTKTPTIINLFCFWALQIPMAYLLAIPLKLGPKGVFLAIIITETIVTTTAFVLFRKGKWKKIKI